MELCMAMAAELDSVKLIRRLRIAEYPQQELGDDVQLHLSGTAVDRGGPTCEHN